MPFPTSTPDLSDTIFTNEDLLSARKYLLLHLERDAPDWLANPYGWLGEYWNRDDAYSACILINFAGTIYRVASNITQRSYPLLVRKIIEGLLNEKAEEKFLETYTELQVASALVNYVSPIALDPLATDETYLQSNNRPRTPDFGIRLPDGDFFLEVTMCYANILDEWDRTGDSIRTKIEQLVFTTYKSRDVSIELPLKPNIDSHTLSGLLSNMDANESGSFSIGGYRIIQWKPVPYDPMTHPVCKVARNLAPLSEEENELLVNAVRNTLDHKRDRKQFPKDVPAILILRLGHHRLVANAVVQLFLRRIWPNKKKYGWISGICLFTPRQAFRPPSPGYHLEWCLNPNATYPVSESMRLICQGNQFHLDL
jgi:hypothetical protein